MCQCQIRNIKWNWNFFFSHLFLLRFCLFHTKFTKVFWRSFSAHPSSNTASIGIISCEKVQELFHRRRTQCLLLFTLENLTALLFSSHHRERTQQNSICEKQSLPFPRRCCVAVDLTPRARVQQQQQNTKAKANRNKIIPFSALLTHRRWRLSPAVRCCCCIPRNGCQA